VSASKFVVITSINPPTESVRAFRDWEGWEVVVVGDRKTPHGLWNLDGVTYLGMDRQTGDLAAAIPENTYTRKMIGYAHAIRHGARFIFDSDDDNTPYPGVVDDVDRIILAEDRTIGERVRTVAGWWNSFKAFGVNGLWPRGFPLRLVHDIDIRPEDGQDGLPWAVIQFMADADPDVDAIGRMLHPEGGYFSCASADSLVLPDRGTFSPTNSQATLWTAEAFPLLFLPQGVSDRMTDILRGYIAQACLWRSGYVAAFAGAVVSQKRNPHDLARDLVDEIPLYVHAADWCRRLVQIGGDSPAACCRAALKTLAEIGAIPKSNLETYETWLRVAGLEGRA
jgi:hypothetical protein